MTRLDDFTDEQLILELAKRGRLRTFSKTFVYYNEMETDERYMAAMENDVIYELVRKADNELCVRNRDRVLTRDEFNRPLQTARRAAMSVLVPKP
jgi:hypothetical protein